MIMTPRLFHVRRQGGHATRLAGAFMCVLATMAAAHAEDGCPTATRDSLTANGCLSTSKVNPLRPPVDARVFTAMDPETPTGPRSTVLADPFKPFGLDVAAPRFEVM